MSTDQELRARKERGEFPKLSREMVGQGKRQKVGLLNDILYSFLVFFSGVGGGVLWEGKANSPKMKRSRRLQSFNHQPIHCAA